MTRTKSIAYEDRSPSNGISSSASAQDALVVNVTRRWWPFVATVGGIILAIAGIVAAGAWFVAKQPTKADVDERIEARAVTAGTVKEMIHDLSPYNADRATVHALPAKLDAILSTLGEVREQMGEVKATATEINRRLDRLERRRDR